MAFVYFFGVLGNEQLCSVHIICAGALVDLLFPILFLLCPLAEVSERGSGKLRRHSTTVNESIGNALR